MKPLPFREVKRRLEAVGFVQVSQRGSHKAESKEQQSEELSENEISSLHHSNGRQVQPKHDGVTRR